MGLRNMDTPEARKIWADVEEAAKRCPEWIKPIVQKAARELATRIRCDEFLREHHAQWIDR